MSRVQRHARVVLGRATRALTLASLAIATPLHAQTTGPAEGIAIGDWWFRPSLELRTRGGLWTNPAEVADGETAVLASLPGAAPIAREWLVHARSRVGLSIERAPLTAAIVIQDARLWGVPAPSDIARNDLVAATSVHTAFFEVHTAEMLPSFVRLGRQEVSWGDGRLVGISDWSPTPRALDAVRGRLVTRAFDIEGLVTILAPPGALPPEYAPRGASGGGTGAQLYGLQAAGHFDPLLHAELTGLARIARVPLPPTLTPGDTFVTSVRVFGDNAGFSYAAEGAYELGRIAAPALASRRLESFAATAHFDWRADLLLHPKLGVSASYATGDDGGTAGAFHRFDPILPDNRSGLGQMGLYAWSNVFDVAALASIAASEQLTLSAAYRYVRLANPKGAWFAASLAPIGQDSSEASPFLGHEIDAAVAYTPYAALSFRAGYGAFITGPKARAILSSPAHPAADALHAAFVQATLSAP